MIDLKTANVQIVISTQEMQEFFSGVENRIISCLKESVSSQKDDPEKIFDVKGAANFLNVTPQTIHNYKRIGKIPFHRGANNKPYFKKSELIKSLNSVDLEA